MGAGAGCGAGLPQQHRHGVLPAAAAIPARDAAPRQRALQGLRQDAHRLRRRRLLHRQGRLQVCSPLCAVQSMLGPNSATLAV